MQRRRRSVKKERAVPRILLCAPASGSGKTLITCGILQALVNRGKKVASFKCGPDYIDPMFHGRVIGTKSRNLDTFFTGDKTTAELFMASAKNADISVMEGVMGLYDGLGGIRKEGSAYDLATVTDTPVILVIDATEGVTEQDAKIAGIAHDRGKGIIVAVNKWDAIEKNDKTIYEFTKKIKDTLSFMQYAEMVFISAVTGQRMNKMFELIDMVRENQTMRIATGVLNEIMTEAVAMQQPPSDKGKRLKLYYMTQVAVKPPTFVIFVNDKELMHFSYVRYLENRIRESFGFKGTALKFLIRERNGKEE